MSRQLRRLKRQLDSMTTIHLCIDTLQPHHEVFTVLWQHLENKTVLRIVQDMLNVFLDS
jgi:hypothetical protein